MRAILLLLLLGHYADKFLAASFGGTPMRWFYVLQGFSGMLLFALVALAVRHWIPRAMAVWGAVEQSMVGSCGLARLHLPPPFLKPNEGICDTLGLHVYMPGLLILFAFAVLTALELKGQR